ncbi:hypothetical protein ACFPZ0_11605 [Streptomonospora nanhaiensis]|uniref:Uncharacterized protein n=1 Tax=Streptomonospora nanhaiensis TaxID=1323731 RepID=A0A853BM45_9ACTN|nr:hypothetical protein [Streptomonospora nanhaiensis]MBV2366073.1 hypothetical protein [Streptomonospora nanhaiensis]MBX9388893.1 hypothetical protein [Streptomonospora nanhaiensis]NYI96548.1 hypothetical protein [Streptomonospora nanhaiensis]
MSPVLVAAAAAVVAAALAALSWWSGRHYTRLRVYRSPGEDTAALAERADRAADAERRLGAATGHAMAWRDLLADAARERAGAPGPADPVVRESAQRIRARFRSEVEGLGD